MPETIRATGRRLRARLLRQGFTAGSVAVIAALTGIAPARADGPSLGANLETVDLYLAAFAALDRHEIVTLVLMLGILFFAVTSSVMLVRTRVRNAAAQAAYRDEIIRLKGAGDRLSALLFSERQILVSWAAASDAPVIMGDTSLVTDVDGAPAYWVALLADISDRKRLEARLEHQAFHDPLTGLYNRRYLETHLAQLIEHAANRGKPLSVLTIDVDFFKSINDTHGHPALFGGTRPPLAMDLYAPRVSTLRTPGTYVRTPTISIACTSANGRPQ